MKVFQMKGALVFLAVFLILMLATIAYSELPPGGMIYDSFNFPTTTYKILDTFAVRTVANALINGAIYGIIAWIIYTIAERTMKPKTQPQPQTQQPQTPSTTS
jgi:hypothetical protein